MTKKYKRQITYLVIFFVIVILARIVPLIRNKAIDPLKFSLSIFNFIGREARALVFFHRNFVDKIKLDKEISLLRQKLSFTEEIYQENRRLKNLLDLKQQSRFILVAARVIGKDPTNWSSTIIIDKGANSGIKPSMPVIAQGGFVGKVCEVNSSSSKITLITDSNLGVAAMLERSREEGLVSGTLGNLLIMRYLAVDADIKISDKVITSSLSQIYPKGIVIGEVVEIGTTLSGLSLFAMIKPIVNFSSLEEVLIIIK